MYLLQTTGAAVNTAMRLLDQGADILDIGEKKNFRKSFNLYFPIPRINAGSPSIGRNPPPIQRLAIDHPHSQKQNQFTEHSSSNTILEKHRTELFF